MVVSFISLTKVLDGNKSVEERSVSSHHFTESSLTGFIAGVDQGEGFVGSIDEVQ